MNEHETNEATGAQKNEAVTMQGLAEEAVDSAKATVTELREEAAAARDRALRAQAELDNYRKRVRKEMEDERRYAQLPLLSDLLPVIDNMQRAILAAEKSSDASGLLAGFKMVVEQLEGVLARHQCQRIEALHQPFDPNFHAAVMLQPSSEYAANTVVQVTQEGYRLHDRVIRPAQVIVSTEAKTGNE